MEDLRTDEGGGGNLVTKSSTLGVNYSVPSDTIYALESGGLDTLGVHRVFVWILILRDHILNKQDVETKRKPVAVVGLSPDQCLHHSTRGPQRRDLDSSKSTRPYTHLLD